MKQHAKKLPIILVSAMLLLGILAGLIMAISGGTQPFTGQIAAYCDALVAQGFPEDYATALTRLHLLHPNWEFEPLLITETNKDYTWAHVIDKETENPATNLISASDTYSDYRHPFNRELYDSGFYQPSRSAVEYFMDPRNFLNEADIFQFYDLSGSKNPSIDAVKAVLSGTFMENAVLENGVTYADYLVQIGAEIGIDPVYLAVKLRQEQGVGGTSPIISGTCGDLLLKYYDQQTEKTEQGKPINPPKPGDEDPSALTDLNGLYNPFNVGAGGTGVYQIYKKAMIRAEEGTSSMANAWGDASWSTMWKGLYGGALFIKEKYIDRYQSTIYLQKFNVDGRIPQNNFWSQYMQNLTGALTEGRSYFRSCAEIGSLDAPCRFLIPVYAEMPQDACSDPARGKCTTLTPASNRFETTSLLTAPERLRSTNDGVFCSATVQAGATEWKLEGKFTHSYGVQRLQYSYNGGEWIDCSEDGSLSIDLSENLPDYGEHILVIRAVADYDPNNSTKKLSANSLCVALSLTVQPPPSVKVSLQAGNTVADTMHYVGTTLTLPSCSDENFVGWVGSNGTILPSEGSFTVREDIHYTALFVDFRLLEGAALSLNSSTPTLRFYAVLPESAYRIIHKHTDFGGQLLGSEAMAELQSSCTVPSQSGTDYRRLSFTTAPISEEDYNAPLSASLSMRVTYSDGSNKQITAAGTPTPRSAAQLASAALSDPLAHHTPAQRATLETILTSSRKDLTT